MATPKAAPYTPRTEPLDCLYAKVESRHQRQNLEPPPEISRRDAKPKAKPKKSGEKPSIYENNPPPIPKKTKELKKQMKRNEKKARKAPKQAKPSKNKDEKSHVKGKPEPAMMKEREVKALAAPKKSAQMAAVLPGEHHVVSGQKSNPPPLLPSPKSSEPSPEPGPGSEQQPDASMYELAGPMMSVYDNISPTENAKLRQQSVSADGKAHGKGSISKRPKPTPRNPQTPVNISGNAVPMKGGVANQQRPDEYIYEEPIPVNPAMVGNKRPTGGSTVTEPTAPLRQSWGGGRPRVSPKAVPAGYSVGDVFCLYIYEADVTKLRVDAITNAANEELRHAGGVARNIADAAGPNLVKESERCVKKNKITTSDVVITTAGKLPCKKVMHAVGPRWPNQDNEGMREECRSLLTKTFENVFARADKERYKSIALTPISSGIFGVPGEIVTKSLRDALLTSCLKYPKTKLKEIHIVDIRDDLIQILARDLSNPDGGCLEAPNGKQVSIQPLPHSDIQRVISGNYKRNANYNSNKKLLCGLGGKK